MTPKEGDEGRVRPFANGSQYTDWTERNCDCCALGMVWDVPVPDNRCEIERALSRAAIGDGTIGADLGRRMGLPLVRPGPYLWRCGEWQEEGEA